MISLPTTGSEDEISSLIATLHEAERRLEELTGGEVDTVSTGSGQPFMLRRAQAELRNNVAAKQAAILNALPAQIALLDAQGVIVSVNEAWRQFATANYLQDPELGVGTNYLETCDRARGDYSAEAHQAAEGIRAVLAGAKNFALEYPCHSPTEKRWFLMTVTPLTDARAHGAVVMHLNITERRQAEATLKELSQKTERRERMLTTTLSNLHDFAYIYDRAGRFLFANQPLLNLWGRTLDEVVGRNFFDLGYPDELAGRLQRQIQEVIDTRQSVKDETPYTSPAGVAGFYEYILSPTLGADGTVEYVVGSTRDVSERKKANDRLQQTDQLYRHAIAGAGAVAYEYDYKSRGYVFIGEEIESLTGYRAEEISGPLWQRITQESIMLGECAGLDKSEAAERVVRGSIKSWRCDMRILTRDGQTRWISDSSVQKLDLAGKLTGSTGILQDITERKQAETALRESNLKFQQLADNITDVFWIRSPDCSELHYVSPAFERIWGRSVASLQANPKQWGDFILPEDRERVTAAFAALTDRAPTLEIEYRIMRPEGEIRWVRVRGFQVRNAKDQLVRHIGIVTDITAQIQAATELRTSLAEFRQLAESMPQIVWITTADGRNIYFSQQWMDYTGLTLEESLGEGWNKPFHPEDQQQAWTAWQQATATTGIYSVESRLRRADGVYRWWLVRGVPQRDAAGNILKWFGTCTDIHDMKLAGLEIARANRTLQQQQTELRAVIDMIPATIAFKDTKNIYRRVNRWFANAAGRPVVELEGKSSAEIFAGEAGRYDADDLQVMNSGKPELGLVKRSRDRQGNEVWHQIDKVPVCEEGGNVVGLVIMAQDITERRKLDEAMQASEEHFRFLTHLSDAMRQLTTPEHIMAVATRMLGEQLGASRCAYADVNKDNERLTILQDYTDGCASSVGNYDFSRFGMRAVSVVRNGKTLVIRDVDAEHSGAEGADAFNAIGVKAIVSCPLIKKNELCALMSVHQTSPRDWKPSEIVLIEEVATRCWATIQRQNAEENLRKSEAMLRIAARTARLGGWSIELPGFRLFWSDEVCALLEVAPGTAPTLEQAVAFYAPESQEPLRQVISACAQHGTPFDLELGIITAKGNRIEIRATGDAERNAAGEIIRMHGAFQDITERKKLEQQFHQAQKMDAMGTLAGGIAHDFNNVLAAIKGYTELSRLQLKGNPVVHDYLGSVLQATNRAADLVQQILTFSRQERPKRQPIELLPVVEETLKLLRASIPSTIEFDLALAADTPAVLADATQIHQILMNLGTNAWHAMKDRPGRLRVKLEAQVVDEAYAATQARLRPGHYARLSVSDTGSGMEPATLRRIFEPFFTTKPVGEGTGLGLSVVHGIMASHDGAVTVYSQPGEGTVFHLYFPAHAGKATAVVADNGPTPDGHGEQVLFIDDEALLIQLGQRTLTALGYVVEVAQDPVAALKLVQADPARFALVITDQTMPGMTGLMLATELKRLRPGLPVILMTGYGFALTPERIQAAGIHQLLIKPTTIHSLGTAVHAALSAQPTP